MAIEGQLEYGRTLQNPMAANCFPLAGEDGNYFIQAHYVFGPAGKGLYLSKIDTQDEQFFTLTQTEARARLDTLGLSGVVSSNWYFGQQGGLVAPGTPYFFIPMFGSGGAAAGTINLFLRYKIDSGGSAAFDGYTGGACSIHAASGLYSNGAIGYWFIGVAEVSNYVIGAQVIGSYFYMVINTGSYSLFSNSVGYHLVRIPLAGNAYSDITGAWDAYITRLPAAGDVYLNAASGRLYTNRASIMEEPGGGGLIRVLNYLSQADGIALGFGGAALVSTVVDPAAHTATAWANVSSTFGIPFDDTLKNYAGTLTANARNDYSAPSVLNTNDLFFMRPYNDALNIAQYRKFTIGGAGLTDITALLPVQNVYTTVAPSGLNGQCEFIQGYKGGSTLYTMGRFNTQYVFGDVGEYPTFQPPVTAEYPPTTDEDTVEDLPEADALIQTQRWLLRTGHIRGWGEVAVDDLRVTMKRGVGDTEFEPKIWVRVNRDNRGFGKWAKRGLGKKGDRFMTIYFGGFGTAKDWQFEFATTDDCEIDLRKVEILPTSLGH